MTEDATPKWWQRSTFYQIYPRSFAAAGPASGEGTGNLAGITSRLGYLAELGIDALWICPVFRSPQVDHGYDVADFYEIDSIFGTLADFDELIEQAHRRNIKVITDIVPSHTSSEHDWFASALREGPGSAARARYLFRDGRGPSGERAPTGVLSSFGGPAWTRVTEADGRAGQWYFHMHAAHQPDLNWADPTVLADFESIFRFWLDRGIDGFRIDVADHLTKDVDRTDAVHVKELLDHSVTSNTHAMLRALRAVVEEYPGDRAIVGEVGAVEPELSLYVRDDELPMVFNFPFLHAGWSVTACRESIDDALELQARTGALPTWVTDSHDEPRSPTRYSSDPAIGMSRARAMALLLLALPGAAFIYQGQELGLANVDDIPEDQLQDPMWEQSGHSVRGRDGCRVPLPWSGEAAPFGFGNAPNFRPWLPQPEWFAELTAQRQQADPSSMLALYRRLLGLRRTQESLHGGTFRWVESEPDVLAFERCGDAAVVRVAINFSQVPVVMGVGEIVAGSAPDTVKSGVLSPDAAVWLLSGSPIRA